MARYEKSFLDLIKQKVLVIFPFVVSARYLVRQIFTFSLKAWTKPKNAWSTLMTTKHCFLSITIFLCDICMEVSNCVRNKRQVIHSFFDDRTIKGNRHVLTVAMCVSFKTIFSYNIMSHKLVIFSKVYFLNSFW